MPYAAALSEHPVPVEATGEVVGRVLEQLDGTPPDLAVLFVSRSHAGALEDITSTIDAILSPGAILGCTAGTVVGGGREVEDTPAVSLWAGHTGPVVPFHLSLVPAPGGHALIGWPEVAPAMPTGVLLLADPFTFPTEAFLAHLADEQPGLPVVGGMASAGQAPGANRLVSGRAVVQDGAVGALFGPAVHLTPVVSQGCRPVGGPLVVTRSERNLVYELGGRPALARLEELARAMPEDERQLLSRGLHLGRVIDEHKMDFGRGDFLIRNVLGGDRETGAIAVGDVVEIGATTQFQVRDADSAHEDLDQLLSGCAAEAALLFTCNGRGTHLFGVADHDASLLVDHLPGAAVAGMSCAGELGPVGGRNFLHGFTASVALMNGPG